MPRRSTWTARSGGVPTCCSGWPKRATSRSRKPTPPWRGRSCSRHPPAQPIRSRPTSSRKCARTLESRYGAKPLYENGLSIQTGLDVKLQEAAKRALDEGLRRIDKRRGFRKPRRNILAEGQTIDSFKHARWDRPIAVGDVVPAVVTDADGAAIQVRAGPLHVVDRSQRLRVDRQDHRRAARQGRGPRRNAARSPWMTRRTPRPERSSRRRSSKARCSRSTIEPGRFAR